MQNTRFWGRCRIFFHIFSNVWSAFEARLILFYLWHLMRVWCAFLVRLKRVWSAWSLNLERETGFKFVGQVGLWLTYYGLVFIGVGKNEENMGAILPLSKCIKNARFCRISAPPPSSMLILKKGSRRFARMLGRFIYGDVIFAGLFLRMLSRFP